MRHRRREFAEFFPRRRINNKRLGFDRLLGRMDQALKLHMRDHAGDLETAVRTACGSPYGRFHLIVREDETDHGSGDGGAGGLLDLAGYG